jgi:hypothetical protein
VKHAFSSAAAAVLHAAIVMCVQVARVPFGFEGAIDDGDGKSRRAYALPPEAKDPASDEKLTIRPRPRSRMAAA